MSQPTQHGRDDGFVLPLALVFIVALALTVTALSTLTATNLRASRVTRDYIDDLYARDGGLEFGIDRIQAAIAGNPALCGTVADPPSPLGSTTVNGVPITVSCDMTNDGSSGGGPVQPIVYLTGNSPDSKSEGFFYFDDTEGGTIRVDAKVYNEGKFYIKDSAGSTVDFGRSIEQKSGSCQSASMPSRMSHSGSPWDCPSSISSFPFEPMSTMWAPSSSAPGPQNAGGCRYFYPGRYNSAPNLHTGNTNYFASGVYYFRNNVGTFDIENVLIGGETGGETSQLVRPSCANDAAAWAESAAADPITGDTGVVFIFEGDAAMKVPSNTNNRLELHTYRAPAAAPSLGVAGYSVIAPTSGGSNWATHTKSILIETDSVEPGLISIHGLVFAPNTHLKLRLLSNAGAIEADSYMFSAGMIVASIELITSGLPANKEIHFAGGPGGASPATIVVEATNPATGRTSVAALKYVSSGPDPLSLLSWRATDDG